jgi:hypothetical protein
MHVFSLKRKGSILLGRVTDENCWTFTFIFSLFVKCSMKCDGAFFYKKWDGAYVHTAD